MMKIQGNKSKIAMKQVDSLNVNKIDWFILISLAVFSFFAFNHIDLLITAQHSYAYLKGNILNFYDACYAMNETYSANYLPLTFIIFAIWNIPLMLIGKSPKAWGDWSNLFIFWNKLLPVLAFFLSAWILYKLVNENLGMDKKKAKYVAYIYMTAPIAFFSQFMFCQYDIFTTLAMLVGMRYFFQSNGNRKKWIQFCICFGIAISFKYYAVLVFAVLLLLKEKNVWKILLSCIIAVLPCMLQAGVYLVFDRDAFIQAVFGFGVLEYANASSINIGLASIRLLPLGLCLIAAAAYLTKPKNKNEEISYSIFYICGMFCVLFSFMTWHPQWLLIAVPFWIIGISLNKNYKILFWLELLFFAIFTVFIVNAFANGVDQSLLKNGIFSNALQYSSNIDFTMADIFKFKDKDILFSLLVVLFTVFFIYNHPRFHQKDFSYGLEDCKMLVRGRFIVSMLIFIIPAFLCLPKMLEAPEKLWSQINMKEKEKVILGTDDSVAQYATILGDSITDVYINTAIKEEKNLEKVVLLLDIYDAESDEFLAESSLNGEDINENGEGHFKVENCFVIPGKQYKFVIRSNSGRTNPIYLQYGIGTQTISELYDTVLKDYSKDGIVVREKEYKTHNYHIISAILGHYRK